MAQASSMVVSKDAHEAVRNGLKLGLSLLVTLSMSFGVRLLLPRFLGPSRYGPLNFAEAFTAGFFVLLGLGMDVYVRREVSVRPGHAVDFFGGILLTRLLLSTAVFALMGWVMTWGHRSEEERRLVWVYGIAQLLVTTNTSLSALLHARAQVDGLSISSVATKALWGTLILVAIALNWGLVGIALALPISEAVQCTVLCQLVRRHLGWPLALNLRATWAVILTSLPFYLNTVAHTVYSKLGVSMLAFISGDSAEVGRYGAAANFAGLTLLVTPLIGWVLLPLYSKAQSRSDEEFNLTLRRSLEFILTLGFPISLMLAVGADVWMALAFGPAYASGALALRILAPLFLLTYVAMVSATCLISLKRAWTMTAISLVGLCLNPVLNWVFIRAGLRLHGPEGAGAACAIADVGTELCVTVVMMGLVGYRAFDLRNLSMVAKTAAVCLVVVAVDRLGQGLGPARLVLDAGVYVAGVVTTGAVRPRELFDFTRATFERRRLESQT